MTAETELLDEDAVMALLIKHFDTKTRRPLTYEQWRDGIEVTRVSGPTMNFVLDVVAAVMRYRPPPEPVKGEIIRTKALSGLLALAGAAWVLLDGTANSDPPEIEQADWDALSMAMDALDALPDDQPGYTMDGPAKAAWALRAYSNPEGKPL